MNEREDLAAIISAAVGGYNQSAPIIMNVVDAILAAGYSKQEADQ